MTSITTKPDSSQFTGEMTAHLFDNWFDPIESAVRERVRGLISPRRARGDHHFFIY